MRASPLCLLLLAACRSPLPEPTQSGDDSATLTIEPTTELDAVLPVSRFKIADPDATDALLFTGELSDYYLRKIEAGEPPNTLLERSVECASFVDAGELVLSPVAALTLGETYSLASAEHGLLGTFQVTSEPTALLSRVFPESKTPASPRAVFCGVKLPPAFEPVSLQPGNVELDATLGVLGDATFSECITLQATAALPDGSYVPPPTIAGISLDPSPWIVADTESSPALTCEATEQRFSRGCVQVLDDRAIVRAPAASALFSVSGDVPSRVFAPEPEGRFLIPDLVPSTNHALSVGFADVAGTFERVEVLFTTGAPKLHVVINEVLANPLGAEPAEEWIELVNDGALPVELEGFTLADSAGPSVLPAHSLAPGAFVILAREDFVRDDGSDVAVPEGVAVLSLTTLGKNGLTNSGEKLELRDASGQVLSQFPALPKPKAGVSVARREPSALDDAPGSFALHAAPGASPGAPNEL